MREACKDAGIPEPEFKITGFFTILFRRKASENFGLNFRLNETQSKILEIIKKDHEIQSSGHQCALINRKRMYS